VTLQKKVNRHGVKPQHESQRCDGCSAGPLVGNAIGGFITITDPLFGRRHRCQLCESCMLVALRGPIWGDPAAQTLIQHLINMKRLEQ
jgi:hypothetical protein